MADPKNPNDRDRPDSQSGGASRESGRDDMGNKQPPRPGDDQPPAQKPR